MGRIAAQAKPQAGRGDTVEIIVDVAPLAAHPGGGAVEMPVRIEAIAKIQIEPVKPGIGIGKAQRCRITIHGRDHLDGRIDHARRGVIGHALDEIIDRAVKHGRPGIGRAEGPVQTRLGDPRGFRRQVRVADIGIAVGQPSRGFGRQPGEAFDIAGCPGLAGQGQA